MVPGWVAILLSTAVTGLLLLLIKRERTWFRRHDKLQDTHIALLKKYEDLLEENKRLIRNALKHYD